MVEVLYSLGTLALAIGKPSRQIQTSFGAVRSPP
jgi:hypothetical protein